MSARETLAKHPDAAPLPPEIVACVDACAAAARACRACADACLAEEDVADLRQCIRLDLDCAAVCDALAEIASRRTGYNESVIRLMLEACSQACRDCAMECGKHAARHEHCAACRDTCLACAKACDEVAATVWPPRSGTVPEISGM